ncbi:formyltransferase family protein [Planctomycetota bacterium]
MKFGHIESYLLFGGGQVLFDTALSILERGRRVFLVTSRRHASSLVKHGTEEVSLADALEALEIPSTITADVGDEEELDGLVTESAMGISVNAEWVFKQDFIEKFKGRLVNLHGTRLPRFRGGGGSSWRIMMSQQLGGCTIHLIDPGIDTGRIVIQYEYLVPEECRKPIDYDEYSTKQYYSILQEFIDGVERNRDFEITKQQESMSAYWPRLNTDVHGYINWSWSLYDIEIFINAFEDPYKGASSFIGGKRVYLKDVFSTLDDGSFHPFQAGLIYRQTAECVFVAATQGSLVVQDIRDGKGVSVLERIHLGDRFYAPTHLLEAAMQYRCVYVPKKD